MYIDIASFRPVVTTASHNDLQHSSAPSSSALYACGFFAAAVIVISVRRFIQRKQRSQNDTSPYSSEKSTTATTLAASNGRVDSVALHEPECFPLPEAAQDFAQSYAFFKRTHFYDYEGDYEPLNGGGKAIYEQAHVFEMAAPPPPSHSQEDQQQFTMPPAFSRRTVRVFGAAKA